MKITNKHNIAPIFERAILSQMGAYDKGDCDYTATDLIKPPRMYQLIKRHWHEIEVDLSDQYFLFFGGLMHLFLEQHAPDNSLTEERLIVDIDGIKVGGKPDVYEPNSVHDYKATSAWSFVNTEKPEWIAQLNIYAYLLRRHGFPVDKLTIHAFIRDWDFRRAQRELDYPQTGFHTVDIPLKDEYLQRLFIEQRIKLHEISRFSIPDNLHFCTPEERWQRETTYPVILKDSDAKKPRARNGTKDFTTPEQAEEYIRKHPDKKLTILERPGESVRCENFCLAKPFCNQYKEGM